MPGRLGPRFAIEALFLIALAVGAAYADLAAKWIVLVMAVGWLVVALLELSTDRIWAAAPPWRRPYYMPVPPPRAEPAAVEPVSPTVEPESEVGSEPAPAPEREPAPAPQAEAVTTVIAPPAPESADAVEPEPEAAPEPATAAAGPARPSLEPLEPKPRRRWFRHREREAVAVDVPEIELPKHVRLLPAAERTDQPDEVAELFDATEHEEPTRR